MIKTVFLLTISMQCQADSDENNEKYQLGDFQLIQYLFLRTHIIRF